jgi:hypothetical protein
MYYLTCIHIVSVIREILDYYHIFIKYGVEVASVSILKCHGWQEIFQLHFTKRLLHFGAPDNGQITETC